MSLAENLYFDKSASIAFDQSNVNGLSLNTYYKQKEETNRFIAEKFPLFLIRFVGLRALRRGGS